MYLSTSLKPSKQAVLLDQRLDKIKASLLIANQKKKKMQPKIAMVTRIRCNGG